MLRASGQLSSDFPSIDGIRFLAERAGGEFHRLQRIPELMDHRAEEAQSRFRDDPHLLGRRLHLFVRVFELASPQRHFHFLRFHELLRGCRHDGVKKASDLLDLILAGFFRNPGPAKGRDIGQNQFSNPGKFAEHFIQPVPVSPPSLAMCGAGLMRLLVVNALMVSTHLHDDFSKHLREMILKHRHRQPIGRRDVLILGDGVHPASNYLITIRFEPRHDLLPVG